MTGWLRAWHGAGTSQGGLCHVGFGPRAATRDPFDGLSVTVAGLEIHLRIVMRRIARENSLDQADAVEKILPGNRSYGGEIGNRTRDAFGWIKRERFEAGTIGRERRALR